jgi:hypothetical protein
MNNTSEKTYKYSILIDGEPAFTSKYMTLREIDEETTSYKNAQDLYSDKADIQAVNVNIEIQIQHFDKRMNGEYELVEPVLYERDEMVLEEEQSRRSFESHNIIVARYFLDSLKGIKDKIIKKRIEWIRKAMSLGGFEYVPLLEAFLRENPDYEMSRMVYLTNMAGKRGKIRETQIEQLMSHEDGYDAISRGYDLDDLGGYPDQVFDGQGKRSK